jgi:hypothetical protein
MEALRCVKQLSFYQSIRHKFYEVQFYKVLIGAADPSGRPLAGIVGSNTAEGMGVSVVSVVCCQV